MLKLPEREPLPLAAFDLDGTTFKTSVLEALVDVLVGKGIYSDESVSEITELRSKWEGNNSERLYLDYIQMMVSSFMSQLSGRQVNELSTIANDLLHSRVMRKRRFAVESMKLLSRNYRVVAISGSPQIAVEIFAESLQLEASFGSRLGQSNGVFDGTGRTIDKVATIEHLVESGGVLLEGSVSFGDTFSDAPMLGMTDSSICVNPSSTFEIEARNRGWHIVRESKDNISHVTPDGRYHGVQTTLDILERIRLNV